ncbi:MAG: TrkA C-terminal domain-containing protein [Planctomycetota bacterium]
MTPHLADLLEGSHTEGGIQMSEMTVIEGSSLEGATVRDCGMQHDSVVFVALQHADGDTRLRPRADQTLRAGDTLIVAGETMALATMRREAGELAQAA